MERPLRIRYLHTQPSDALDALIQEKAQGLERYFSRIVGCEVTVEAPGGHHRKGRGAHYRVRIELSVPGELLVVSRDPEADVVHEDAFWSTNEAFHTLRRQLQDYVRRRRGDVKAHQESPHARVARLLPAEGYGFLLAEGGREVYFHRSSVLDGFERLTVGDEVRFAEEQGDEGPQASSVERVGVAGHHAVIP